MEYMVGGENLNSNLPYIVVYIILSLSCIAVYINQSQLIGNYELII